MAFHDRAPVIVGVGQYKQQLSDVSKANEQYLLMEQALRAAADDANCSELLRSIDRMLVIGGMWSYPDPGRLISDSVGSLDAKTFLTAMGGNMPQASVSDCCQRIAAGEMDVAVVVGGKAVYSKNKLKKTGRDLNKTGTELKPAERFGENVSMSSQHERDKGFVVPTQVYALFESTIRADRNETHDQHRQRISNLWAGLNRVAVQNPYAWVRTPMSAEEIMHENPDNRMVGYPYTKAMNANSFVDFGGAIIICSVGKAKALGINPDQWVFPHAATDGNASYFFSERQNFHQSPAIRLTGNRCLELAEISIDEVGPMDLYSCFPSVVQITMNELGVSPAREVTTTGGLSFFGGPMNSYVIHAIASTVDAVRSSGKAGFVHANGGYATKHACAVYKNEPPKTDFRRENMQKAIDAYPTRAVDENPVGASVIEAYTVVHGREGPQVALVTAIMDDGRRALSSTSEISLMDSMMKEEFVGTNISFQSDGSFVIKG
ncbi:MAG: acetyl-CoA acetyltransferase [Acidimicrobiaceae bacterium]|nr:acetyl-CoA acetyltransferase [Acidimicrobiaceae bacterium]